MRRFCYLSNISAYSGIIVSTKYKEKGCSKLISIIQKCTFPLILHMNSVYCLWNRRNHMTINYVSFLDLLLYTLPCFIWWAVFNRRNLTKHILEQLFCFKTHMNIKNSGPRIRHFTLLSSFSMIIISVFVSTTDKGWSNGKVQCTPPSFVMKLIALLQDRWVPLMFTNLYFEICVSFIEIFKYIIRSLNNIYTFNNEISLRSVLRQYMEIIMCLEKFSDSFSVPVFLLVCQNIFHLSFTFLDILSMREMTNVLQVSLSICIASFMLGIVSISAAEISLKIESIRNVLHSIKIAYLFRTYHSRDIKIIDTILSRNRVQMTACYIFTLDRGFLLKVFAAVATHSVLYYQITVSEDEMLC